MSVSRVSAEPYPGEGVGPVHSREVPLPLTRDYFEALTLQNPNKASNRPRTISRIVDRVGMGTEGISFTGAEATATGLDQLAMFICAPPAVSATQGL